MCCLLLVFYISNQFIETATHEPTLGGKFADRINFSLPAFVIGLMVAIYKDRDIKKWKLKLFPFLFLLTIVAHFWIYKLGIVDCVLGILAYLMKREK